MTIIVPDDSDIIIKNDKDSIIGKYFTVFDNSYIICISEEIPHWTNLLNQKVKILTEPFEMEKEDSHLWPTTCVIAQAENGKLYRIKFDKLWMR